MQAARFPPTSRSESSRSAAARFVVEVDVARFFAGAADRDDACRFMAVCEERRPDDGSNPPNDLKPWLVRRAGGDFDPGRIRLQRLRLGEVPELRREVRPRRVEFDEMRELGKGAVQRMRRSVSSCQAGRLTKRVDDLNTVQALTMSEVLAPQRAAFELPRGFDDHRVPETES